MSINQFKFDHPSGVHIAQSLTEKELKEALPNIKGRDMKTGWIWYDLPSCLMHGKKMGMNLAFFKGALREIRIWHDDKKLYGRGWGSWSEKKEKLRVKNTKEWLEKNGFKLRKYSWGEIWVQYDPRDGFGGGGVSFK